MPPRKPLSYPLLGLIVAVATCWIGWRAVRAAQKPPVAVFTPLRGDVGALRVGETADLHFAVENRGDQPLRLLSADGGCGCITTTFPRVIPPHRSGEVVARFEALQYWTGDLLKTLQVRTNDPAHPQAELLVAARVTPAVRIEPNERVNLTYRGATVLHREVELIPEPGSDTRFHDPVSTSAAVSPELIPPSESDPEHRYRLRLAVDTGKADGDLSATVNVPTTNPHVKTVPVYVNAQALEGLLVKPRHFVMTVAAGGKDGQDLGGVQISQRDRAVRLVSAETGDSRVSAAIVERSNCFWVMLRQHGAWSPGKITGDLVIRTTDAGHPSVKVPYQITVR